MPAPPNERQALERERKELTDQLPTLQAKLEATPLSNTARLERLAWQIRRAQKRKTEIDRRFAGMG